MSIFRRSAAAPPARRSWRGGFPLAAGLVVVVVIAAGAASPVHFGGPRWLPRGSQKRPSASPKPVHASSSAPSGSVLHHSAVQRSGSLLETILSCVLLAVVVAVAVVLVRRWLRRRPARHGSGVIGAGRLHATQPATPESAPAAPEPEPDAPVLRSGVEQALELLESDLQPADAVLRAWLGLQRSAEQSGIVRRAAETPTEFTTRITSRVFADDRAIQVLLQRYLQVRFGQHEVSVEDVAAVRSALRDLAGTWAARATIRSR